MIQIKKTLLTLVALLAVTTGAWADETPLLTIESINYTSFTSGSMTFDDKVTITFSNPVTNSGNSKGWYANPTASLLTVAGTNGYTITSCKFYTESGAGYTGYTVPGESPSVYLYSKTVFTDANQSVKIGERGIVAIEVFGGAASATPVDDFAWDEAKNTGSFTMPGGNVTLEPDYYPQATVADGAVTAADADARATTDDPLVKVDATKLTGAKKLMYFVSNSGTAPAYDAEGWTDQLPTAESFTEAGIVYVYYYPVGTDEGVDDATATYSDGDICLQSITARIADAPTYAVTFAEGTPETNEWSAEPNTGVKKGTEVTITYTGSKKVIGVKAEKKAAAPAYTLLSEATAADYGKVVCAAGHLHDAKTAVPDGCTAVGILGKVTETGHGLILAMQNATEQTWTTINGWTSVTTYAGTTLKVLPDAARGTNLTSYTALGETAVSNWAVAQKSDYEAIFTNLGTTTGESDGMTYDGNVNAYITTGVGGTAISSTYWSATGYTGSKAWNFDSNRWYYPNKTSSSSIRPVLGF